jgi:hypothetical protein
MRTLPIAIVSRPDCGPRARFAKPLQRFAAARKDAAGDLFSRQPPAWRFLNARFSPLSSSALRARRG